MSNIEQKLKESIAKANSQFADKEKLKQYDEISDKFNELVDKGLARKRGNNLLSLSDKAALTNIQFNSKS